jgi:hypothetical protein
MTADEAARHADARAPRDMTPAVGKPAEPASWTAADPDAPVALSEPHWGDSRWSFLYGEDTAYATAKAPPPDLVADANRSAREGDPPPLVQGPVMKAPLWTWEVPLYFWFGGMAAGSSFVALACDLAGDGRSARVARATALAALVPCPPLLVADLGRPERFYNMLRIFKLRSPMSTGAWTLTLFGSLAAGAVGADLLGRERLARGLGAANAVVGGYLGSYTGVLLAGTAVPVWARSRLFLGPIFVATATATGAAATRLALVATGVPAGHPTREALGRVEAGAMATELVLSEINEHRLGRLADALRDGSPGRLFRAARWLARTGLALQVARRRTPAQHAASACYLVAALCFRYGWVMAGRGSARDDEAVARMARARATVGEPSAAILPIEHH